jgi:hypothetical protein
MHTERLEVQDQQQRSVPGAVYGLSALLKGQNARRWQWYQIVFVTCAEYNRCRTYSEMLTYKP